LHCGPGWPAAVYLGFDPSGLLLSLHDLLPLDVRVLRTATLESFLSATLRLYPLSMFMLLLSFTILCPGTASTSGPSGTPSEPASRSAHAHVLNAKGGAMSDQHLRLSVLSRPTGPSNSADRQKHSKHTGVVAIVESTYKSKFLAPHGPWRLEGRYASASSFLTPRIRPGTRACSGSSDDRCRAIFFLCSCAAYGVSCVALRRLRYRTPASPSARSTTQRKPIVPHRSRPGDSKRNLAAKSQGRAPPSAYQSEPRAL
jgi:hypothetical protein